MLEYEYVTETRVTSESFVFPRVFLRVAGQKGMEQQKPQFFELASSFHQKETQHGLNPFSFLFIFRSDARRYVQEDVPVNTNPTVFVDPPPAYSDLHSSKLKLSEDLPKYEDLLKYERQECHIFATTSSGQFTPPVRMTFRQHSDRCDAEPVVDTRQSSEVISVPQTGPTLAPHGIDNPAHIP